MFLYCLKRNVFRKVEKKDRELKSVLVHKYKLKTTNFQTNGF